MAGLIQFLTSSARMNFYLSEKKIWSQNGEDGVIEAIFNLIGTTNKYYVEFGGGGGECNTRNLKDNGWSGLWMDCSFGPPDFPDVHREFITAENINGLLDKYDVPQKPDLMSIDLDGNDYWVWRAITRRPRVVVIEYNGYLPVDSRNVIKYDPRFQWAGNSYFGAGLGALSVLGESNGYRLAYVDFQLVNAFFIKNETIPANINFDFRKTIRTDLITEGHGEWVTV